MIQKLKTPFNNVQLEILKLFSADLSEMELEEVKRILLEFKFKRVTALADEAWEKKGWTNEDIDQLLHSHLRTPYKSQEEHLKNKSKKS